MKRLFIDCDDTLIKWIDVKKGDIKVREQDTPNQPLISAIERFAVMNPEWTIIIWSGGGGNYASRWAEKYMTQEVPVSDWPYPPSKDLLSDTLQHYHSAISKDVRIPDAGDICVDDQVLKVNALLLSDVEFVEYVTVKWCDYLTHPILPL